MEPTAVVEKAIARVEAQYAALGDDAPEPLRKRGQATIAAGKAKLALAQQRDALQSARPQGCWCFGWGGKDARYIPTIDGDPIEVLSEYCECPDGVARLASDTVERSHYESSKRTLRRVSLFNQALVPPRFSKSTFDTYPIGPTSRAGFAAIREWTDSGQESLLIYGPYGTGKTSLAVAAMYARVMDSGTDALFLTTPDLLDRIRATYAPRRRGDDSEATEKDVLDAVRHASLLVLDDLGAERPTDWVLEKLFTVINFRHDELLPTIFTSNLDPEGLAKHLGERIAWRIVEMSQVVKLDGPNLRDQKGA